MTFWCALERNLTRTLGEAEGNCLAQRASGIAGELKHINGKEYWQVKGRIIKASLSEKYCLNQPTRATFRADYDDEKGYFVMDFECTKIEHNFTWKEVIPCPEDVMFFGPKKHKTRLTDLIFQYIPNIEYPHHVFQGYSCEYTICFLPTTEMYSLYATSRS